MLDDTTPRSSSPDACDASASQASASPLPVRTRFALTSTVYVHRDVTVDFSTGAKLSCRVPVKWSDNAAATLMSKYAVRRGVPDDKGGIDGREVDAERIFDRLVAGWRAAAIEHGYWPEDSADLARFCDEIKAMLEQQIAAPNSPQWFNTGVFEVYGIEAGDSGHWVGKQDPDTGRCFAEKSADSLHSPQISACFIQSVEDNLVGPNGIMDLWTKEARLFKYGSGSGANYSALRGAGEPLTRGGASSGLLSFLKVGDASAGAVKSGGTTRRSARMIIVDVDHPDVEEFIDWKTGEDAKIRALHAAGIGDPSSFEDEATQTVSGQNANNSVAVTDAFMSAVVKGDAWHLINRTDRSISKPVLAETLWDKLCTAAWACADPGLQFSSTINRWHTCKADGDIHGSNPCSEYVFLDDTACNLASLNLSKFVREDGQSFLAASFRDAARLLTIVLDISVSMAGYPTEEIAKRSAMYRTLGLGYAALGQTLVMLGLGYGTKEGREYAAEIADVMCCTAYKTSLELAKHLGPFPRWSENKSSALNVMRMHARNSDRPMWDSIDADTYGLRNAQVTLLAPTGTIGIVMDCETTGVEPYYSDTSFKKLAGGGSMRIASKCFGEALEAHGFDVEDYTQRCFTNEDGRVLEYVWIEPPAELADVLVCASTLTPRQHVDMMAAVQPFLSGAISKTINMPESATVEDVKDIYMHAWKSGLKSIAIYRDGCKPAQPLQGRTPPDGVTRYSTREQAEGRAKTTGATAEAVQDALNDSSQLPHVNATNTVFQGMNVRGAVDEIHGPASESREVFKARLEAELHFAEPDTLKGEESEPRRGERCNPDDVTFGTKHRVQLNGHTFYLLLSEYEGGALAEVFVTASRTGSSISGWVNSWAKMFSLALQHGTPLRTLVDASRGETFEPGGFHDGRPVSSPIDAFARIIEAKYLNEEGLTPRELAAQAMPEFKRMLANVVTGVRTETDGLRATGQTCTICGGSDMRRSGSCFVCGSCGETTGCS